MIFFCGVLYIRQSWQLWKELVLSRAHAPCAISSPITLELLAPPKALCIQREKVDCGNFIWGYTLIATSSVCANFSCLMSPLPFSTLAMKRRSSVVGLSISGQRRLFAVEITELKKGRRGQAVINVPKAAWAKPDPQKHLETCAANVWLSCYHSGRLQEAPSGKCWPKPSSDVHSGVVVTYWKVFHFLGLGHLMDTKEEGKICNKLYIGRCPSSWNSVATEIVDIS